MSRPSEIPSSRSASSAVLLALQLPQQTAADVEASTAEMTRLLAVLGIRVVSASVQRRTSPAAAVVGSGKLEELAGLVAEQKRTLGDGEVALVVDGAISPGQARRLEATLAVEVIDRTGVILRVFEQRARGPLARLEIEIARLTHEAPRVRADESLGDAGGGGGRGERGDTNVELRKQRIRARIADLKRQVVTVRSAEHASRQRRQELLRVALVGYTNSGKSSLLRALTGSDVLIEDKLFATVDTRVRVLSPAAGPRVLVTDTVGFIRDLPHELVDSFRSTLDEARDASLLVIVVDAADPAWRAQLQLTRSTLASIGAAAVPARIVLNKIDRLDDAARADLAREVPGALLMSALDPRDVARLREAIHDGLDDRMMDEVLVVPLADGRLLGEIRASARIAHESFSDRTATLQVRAQPQLLARWRAALGGRAIETAGDLIGLAGLHGLELSADTDLDGSGLDFRVLHAEDSQGTPWILRTPRRPEVAVAAQVEARLLRLVRPRLPVAVPDWRVHSHDLIAYPRLAGTPAVTIGQAGPTWNVIDPAAPPDRFLDSFAGLVAALQAISPDEASGAGAPVDAMDDVRAALARSMEETRAALEPSHELWARWQRWLASDLWPAHTALVHGDLHPGHMLLDEEGRLTGVLDWTEARVTDPSIDLALFAGSFGAGALDALLARIDAAGGRTWPRLAEHAVERWAAFPVLVASWALRTGDAGVLAHARRLLARG